MLMLLKEALVGTTRMELQAAREVYSTAISQRSSSQREVNELLQRKHAWTPSDLERFTALYRSDHANEQAETAAQNNLVAAERRAEEAAARLSSSILARYHEEQIWSDKIRRMSTWGTWGLMGVNVLLFLIFQVGVEPWRRKRLVKGFEEKVMEALEREGFTTMPAATVAQDSDRTPEGAAIEEEQIATPRVAELEAALGANEQKPSENTLFNPEAKDEVASEAITSMSFVKRIQDSLRDLFSGREVIVSRAELTAIALKGAAAGSIITTAFLILLKPKR